MELVRQQDGGNTRIYSLTRDEWGISRRIGFLADIAEDPAIGDYALGYASDAGGVALLGCSWDGLEPSPRPYPTTDAQEWRASALKAVSDGYGLGTLFMQFNLVGEPHRTTHTSGYLHTIEFHNLIDYQGRLFQRPKRRIMMVRQRGGSTDATDGLLGRHLHMLHYDTAAFL